MTSKIAIGSEGQRPGPITAQGNALGFKPIIIQALKGRLNLCLLPAALALTALFLAATTNAFSQTVRWVPSTGTFAKYQTVELQLIFENCQIIGVNELPEIIGGKLHGRGPSADTRNTNGRTTQTHTSNFYIYPTSDAHHITIPSFKIKTDKGEITVPAANFDVSADSDTVTIPPRSPFLAFPVFEQQQAKALEKSLRDSGELTLIAKPTITQIAINFLTAPVTLATDKTFPPANTTTDASKRSSDTLGDDITLWDYIPMERPENLQSLRRTPPTNPSIFLPQFDAPKPKRSNQEK